MRRHEDERVALSADHTQDGNVDSVLKVVFSQSLRDSASFSDRGNVEILPGRSAQTPFGRQRRDASQYGLVWRLELYEKELPMHRRVLEVGAVGQREIGMKFHPALAKTAEYADDLLGWKEVERGLGH